jgi:alkanesulfonate monooxygenase SsuD/methylene tetrahydromethanopterin reductase-like flavin-dependent oxidoreductase (luciferase family)
LKFSLTYGFHSLEGDWASLYENALEQIALAEKYGFDSVFVSEHHFTKDGWFPSSRIACAGIATRTRKIKVGTAIVVLPLDNPIRVAEETALLDIISKGRFILGVGVGNRKEEFEAFGISFNERGSRFEEGVILVKKLLSEPKVTFNGKYYRIKEISIMPKPIQKPSPPIWIAAQWSSKAVKRAARLGDAWLPDPITPIKVLKKHMEVYKEELKKFGKDFYKLERPLRREAYISENAEKAWEEVKDGILYLYGENYYRWGALQDEDGKPLTPEKISFDEYVEVLKKRFIIGGPEDFINEVERYKKELEVNNIVLRIQFPKIPHEKVLKAIKLIGEKVIPYFK